MVKWGLWNVLFWMCMVANIRLEWFSMHSVKSQAILHTVHTELLQMDVYNHMHLNQHDSLTPFYHVLRMVFKIFYDILQYGPH
jgi:hypothetical protein